MPGRGRPRKDARAVKRRRVEGEKQDGREETESVERVQISMDDAQPQSSGRHTSTTNFGPSFIDFAQIMEDADLLQRQSEAPAVTGSCGSDDHQAYSGGNFPSPNLFSKEIDEIQPVQCADDDLTSHVPQQICEKNLGE